MGEKETNIDIKHKIEAKRAVIQSDATQLCNRYALFKCCCPPMCLSLYTELMYDCFCQGCCERKELRNAIQKIEQKQQPLAPTTVIMGQSSPERTEIEEFYNNQIIEEAKAFQKKVFDLIRASKEPPSNYYIGQVMERLVAFSSKGGTFDRMRLSTPILLAYISYLSRQQQTTGSRNYGADYAVVKKYMSSSVRTCNQIGSVVFCGTCCQKPSIEGVLYKAAKQYVPEPGEKNWFENFLDGIDL